jgi:hypothetical protein
MTTFRFSAAIMFLLLVAACTKNVPPADSELGRIARIGDVKETERALGSFAQNHLTDRKALRAELEKAGFQRSVDRDCEVFHWNGKIPDSLFAKSMVVSIRSGHIETTAGYLAP